MVQRIQTEGKRVSTFKPSSSSQYQDGKNRGADFKRKMKKSSKPINLSDFQSSTPSPVRKTTAQPGKPPPPTPTPTPPSALIRTVDGSPNYMKSTSCFDARKEFSQVSNETKNPRKSLENSVLHGSNKTPKIRSLGDSVHGGRGSVSVRKPIKSLSRSSSLKLIRTLTKTPSFKLTRNCLKKSSRVAICEDMNVQRATCSSTLKDSKFPNHLMLNSGGTESKGTSAMKVCPYSYCSLNGHRHASLPPLKSFLSARRRLLKTQKSLKPLKEIDSGEIVTSMDLILGNSKSSHLLNDDNSLNFFVEIYTENRQDVAESFRKEGIMSENCSGFSSFDEEDEAVSRNLDGNFADESMDSEAAFREEIGDFHGNEDEDDGGFIDSAIEEWRFLSFEAADDDLDLDLDQELHGSDDVKEMISTEIEKEICARTRDFDVENHGQDWDVEESQSVISDDQLSYADDVFDEIVAMRFAVEKVAIELGSGGVENALPSSEDLIQNSVLEGSNDEQDIQNVQLDEVYDQEVVINCDVKLRGEMFGFENVSLSSEDLIPNSEQEVSIDKQEIQNVEADDYDHEVVINCDLELRDEMFGIDDEMEKKENKISESCSVKVQANHGSEVAEGVNSCRGNQEEHIAAAARDNSVDERSESESSPVVEIMTNIEDSIESNMDENEITVIPKDIVEGKDSKTKSKKAEKSSYVANHDSEEHIAAAARDNSVDERSESESSPIVEVMTNIEESIESNMDENEITAIPKDILEGKDSKTKSKKAEKSSYVANHDSEEHPESNKKSERNTKCKKLGDELDDRSNFNPREPNYLPLIPDPDGEKVDLKHQQTDDRKNAEEWMLDYALQRTVTKLAPARKKKVALLVEAFESVMPTSKCESQMRSSTSGAFTQAKPIQACF